MISFDPARHADFVASLRAGVTAISSVLNDLQAEGSALRSQWTGEARTAWDDAQTQWQKQMASMSEMLTATAADAEHAGERLQEAEEQALAIWA